MSGADYEAGVVLTVSLTGVVLQDVSGCDVQVILGPDVLGEVGACLCWFVC